MSIDGSKKEYLYQVFTKLYPDKLETILNTKLSGIKIDKKYVKRKVDITAVDDCGRRCFVEFQLSQSNQTHFRQVQELICSNFEESMLIVWIATSFKQEHINEINQIIIDGSNKNIEFVALQLNEKIIPILQQINSDDTFKQIDMLESLNTIERHYELVKGFKIYNGENIINSRVVDKNETYSYKQQYLIDVIKYLREDFKEFVNVHQFKDVSNNYICIGTGVGDIDFRIEYLRSGQVGISLCFTQVNSKKIFYRLLNKREEIENKMDYLITDWNLSKNKISTYVNHFSNKSKDSTIKMLSRIIKRYVYTFTYYINESIDKNERKPVQ